MKTYRNNWVVVVPGFRWPEFRFSTSSYEDDRWHIVFSFIWGKFFVELPIHSGVDDVEYPEYGFYFYKEGDGFFDSFWWCWGNRKFCFHMPWSWDWVRTSVRMFGRNSSIGNWLHENKNTPSMNFWDDKWNYVIYKEIHPYTYTLKSGVVQSVRCTIRIEQREWRWRTLKGLPFPRIIRNTIAVDFSSEIGERSGSWKGGTVGCSYELRDNETPEQCLRRMEKERKF